MKIIKLPCYDIKVTLDGTMVGFGKIESSLGNHKEPFNSMDIDGAEYNGAIDAIESLILAHAVSGIDIESPAYIEGIEVAVEACANNI